MGGKDVDDGRVTVGTLFVGLSVARVVLVGFGICVTGRRVAVGLGVRVLMGIAVALTRQVAVTVAVGPLGVHVDVLVAE